MAVTYQDLLAARRAIRNHVHLTEVVTCNSMDEITGRELYFKCENLQLGGAFKARGATHAIMALGPGPVVTHSSGNHAQAVALAAKATGRSAAVVMPRTAPKTKVAAVRGYGAEVIFCEPNDAARQAGADRLVAERDAHFIHPFDNDAVIAGQGSVMLELAEQVSDLDAVIVPVGGGGLASGTVIAACGRIPVYGVEPQAADDARESLERGHVVPARPPATIADGLLTGLSPRTFDVLSKGISDIVTVSDDDIMEAMWLLYTRAKMVVEPSGAVGLAAVMCGAIPDRYKRLGIIVTGGNVDWSKVGPRFADFNER